MTFVLIAPYYEYSAAAAATCMPMCVVLKLLNQRSWCIVCRAPYRCMSTNFLRLCSVSPAEATYCRMLSSTCLTFLTIRHFIMASLTVKLSILGSLTGQLHTAFEVSIFIFETNYPTFFLSFHLLPFPAFFHTFP